MEMIFKLFKALFLMLLISNTKHNQNSLTGVNFEYVNMFFDMVIIAHLYKCDFNLIEENFP